MEIHSGNLGDVQRYIETHKHLGLEPHQRAYENILRYVRSRREIGPRTRILEIGTGTGWFPCLCKQNGLNCKGLEISTALIEHARQMGARYGIEPDIELGNLEDDRLGEESYDVIIASSVFEHVEFWRKGLECAYRALTPGGALFFESTNKFSVTSGEWPAFPLYGWLPDRARYQLRQWVHGKDIMQHGIDFQQFRHAVLRRVFREVGFREIHDRIDLVDPSEKRGWKRSMFAASKQVAPLKHVMLCFSPTTTFVCVK